MITATTGRTFLVECYAAGIDTQTATAAATRARDVAVDMARRGKHIAYLGTTFIADDEVVFHAFAADDPRLVARASAEAGLRHERIVESVAIDVPDGTGHP